MKRMIKGHTSSWIPLTLALLALSGCGDNGSDGSPGEPGPPTPPPAQEVTELNASLEQWGVTEQGRLTLSFFVTNQDGEGVIGLQSATLLAAQLLPAGATGAGNSTEWRFLGSETCQPSANCPGEWVDNANGAYRYTSAFTVNDREEVSYSAELPVRLVLKLGGDTLPGDTRVLSVINESVDFQPDGGAPAFTRHLVATDSCESCHSDLGTVFHRGNYTETNTCVVCHSANRISNPDNIFYSLAHRVHAQSGLAQFSNCESCHNSPDPSEPLANVDNWVLNPSAQACGACHTNIDFVAGQGHPAQSDNSNCAACHNPDWTRDTHLMVDKEAALARFKAEVTSITPDLAAGSVTVVVSLSDPVSGTPLDSPEQLPYLNDLRLYANWGTSFDYSTRSAPSLRLTQITPEAVVADGQYRYTLTGLTVPPGSEMDEGGAVAIQGRVCRSGDALSPCDTATALTQPIASRTQFFTVGNGMARRDVVSNETCGSCHGDQQLNFHGSRNDLSQQCQLCHNANMTADASAPAPVAASSANFSHMIHAIHTAQREGYEELVYPAPVSDCRQCHIQSQMGDSFALPLADGIPPLSLNDGSIITATAATCSVCHSGATAQKHMEQNGAAFNYVPIPGDLGTPLETCAVCHGPGSQYDIAVLHGLVGGQ
ncbi:OmcA/MtrC family decaheme c-type cytochrome [Ferrimonas gelatinilytica]|uniref:Decaheme c-type cytochrome MtrF n=1 Tax=Ferrimonas gelatinilytica TaxID=1255257 RepID=A0ABP9SEH9_9GAMM